MVRPREGSARPAYGSGASADPRALRVEEKGGYTLRGGAPAARHRKECGGGMDFQLSDEHKLIQETARRVAQEKIAPRAAEIDERSEYPEDIFLAFRELGLLGLSIPSAYGGNGAGMLALELAVEEVAKYCSPSGLILLLSALSTQPILIGGRDEQKKQWGGPVGTGEMRGAFCLTEPSSGSDAASLRTRAVRDGDDYVL